MIFTAATTRIGSIGGNGADRLYGQGGDDLLYGDAGADRIDGGSGNDTAYYNGSTAGVTINLNVGTGGTVTGSGGWAQGDTLFGIENLSGSDFNDRFTGTSAVNTFWGGAGSDTLNTGDGADFAYGGGGNDTINGGTGMITSGR